MSSAIYSCTSYTDEIIDGFRRNTDEAFSIIKKAINEGKVESMLKGPVKQSGFARLVK